MKSFLYKPRDWQVRDGYIMMCLNMQGHKRLTQILNPLYLFLLTEFAY